MSACAVAAEPSPSVEPKRRTAVALDERRLSRPCSRSASSPAADAAERPGHDEHVAGPGAGAARHALAPAERGHDDRDGRSARVVSPPRTGTPGSFSPS